MILIFAIPLLSLLFVGAFALDGLAKEKQKTKKEAERQKRKKNLKKSA